MTLLEKFADPTIIKSMPFADKMLASLYVAILGMGVTFLSLIILWGSIILLGKFVNKIEKKNNNIKIVKKEPKVDKIVAEDISKDDNLELVAVIAAAIAATTNQAISKIFVKNIKRVGDNTSAWRNAGIASQMSNRM